MPPKNSEKVYAAKSYYHIYNRGVDKRTIYTDDKDYGVFLNYLRRYLLPKDEQALYHIMLNKQSDYHDREKARTLLKLNNFCSELDLVCYCLMPNHFHLLVYQENFDTIDRFMNSLSTRYVIYFNRRHDRVGPLFQGVYKAVRVTTDAQLVYLSSYIHRNPNKLIGSSSLESYPYSSYSAYLNGIKPAWVRTKHIFGHFKSSTQYQQFVMDDLKVTNLEKNLRIDDK